jgi:1-acyl-sn-glycerol-3-phosphate acyltransferase
MMLLRSLLYTALMWTSVLLYAPLMLLTAPLPFGWRYCAITAWARFYVWLARWFLGIEYRVEGREHLPQQGAAVVLAKHQSTWETLALPVILPRFTYILKRELMWIPLFGWALGLLRPIAIDRSAGRLALDQIVAQGRERLDGGTWVLAFPEGTRVAPGHKRPYKKGGAVLAVETGYPVVPVAHNAGHFWPRRRVLKRPGTIHVVIGPAIATQGKSAEAVLRQAEHWIEATMARLDAEASRH